MFLKLLLIALPLFAVAQRCEDDRNFRWSYKWNGTQYTNRCSFIAGLSNKNRIETQCNKTGANGVRVRNRCRRSCNNCDDDGSNPQPPRPSPPRPSPGWGQCENGGMCGRFRSFSECWNNCRYNWNNPGTEDCGDGRGLCCICQHRYVAEEE